MPSDPDWILYHWLSWLSGPQTADLGTSWPPYVYIYDPVYIYEILNIVTCVNLMYMKFIFNNIFYLFIF